MNSDRWLILAILFVVRTSMGVQFQTVGAIGPVLIDAFAIDYARLGTLIGLYLLPGVVIALPGGMLGDRFGVKQVALAGLALMILGGLAAAFATSFPMLVIARLVSGTGAVLINVTVAAMVSDWFLGKELRTAMAVVVASWPLGLALGLVAFAPLAQAFGWRAVMIASGAVCLCSLLLLAVTYRAPPNAPAQRQSALPLNLTRHEFKLTLIAGTVWGVYNVAFILLITFLPNLFIAQGRSPMEANTMASLLGWALIAMVPLGGMLADRSGRGDLVMLASFALTGGAVLLLEFPALTPFAFAVTLLAGGLPAGIIMALPASALRPESRAAGMGVYFTCYYGLLGALPAVGGYLRDFTGSEAAPLCFAALMLAVSAAGVLAFRLLARSRSAPLQGAPSGPQLGSG